MTVLIFDPSLSQSLRFGSISVGSIFYVHMPHVFDSWVTDRYLPFVTGRFVVTGRWFDSRTYGASRSRQVAKWWTAGLVCLFFSPAFGVAPPPPQTGCTRFSSVALHGFRTETRGVCTPCVVIQIGLVDARSKHLVLRYVAPSPCGAPYPPPPPLCVSPAAARYGMWCYMHRCATSCGRRTSTRSSARTATL